MTLKCNTQRIRSLDAPVFLERVQFDSDYYDGGEASSYHFLGECFSCWSGCQNIEDTANCSLSDLPGE